MTRSEAWKRLDALAPPPDDLEVNALMDMVDGIAMPGRDDYDRALASTTRNAVVPGIAGINNEQFTDRLADKIAARTPAAPGDGILPKDDAPEAVPPFDFNQAARDYLCKHATPDHKVSARELASHLMTLNPKGSCSLKTVNGLPAWRAYQDEWNRRNPPKPQAVNFSDKMEAVTGIGDKHDELNRLIAEQEEDARQPRVFKRV